MYVKYQNKVKSDREAGVTSYLFQDLVEVNGIELQLSQAEAHQKSGESIQH